VTHSVLFHASPLPGIHCYQITAMQLPHYKKLS